MVARCLEIRDITMSFLLAIGFFGLFRTGELLQLCLNDVNVDTNAVITHLSETKTSGKTGPGEHIVIREPAVLHLTRTFLALQPRRGLIWRESSQQFRVQFSRIISFFRLSEHGYRPYSLRRGGATQLYRAQVPMDLILIKGRWRNSSSARQYISDGMTEIAAAKFSKKTRTLIRMSLSQLGFSSSSEQTSW